MTTQKHIDSNPNLQTVQKYYDDRTKGKFLDFTNSNPRIEAAVEMLAEWAPTNPGRILEIGCGIGATTWRMARAWPNAEVIGVDVSPKSIEVANLCFNLPNLSYRQCTFEPGVLSLKFDLVLMMDVYEHIAVENRPSLHTAINECLTNESRVVVTVPTPSILDYAREHSPEGIQPVDENIGHEEIKTFADDTNTDLLYYRKIGIWNYGDYAHLVFGRFKDLELVSARQPRIDNGVREKLITLVTSKKDQVGETNYLGTDVLSSTKKLADKLQVSAAERRKFALAWGKKCRPHE